MTNCYLTVHTFVLYGAVFRCYLGLLTDFVEKINALRSMFNSETVSQIYAEPHHLHSFRN